jgi:hypothetical protein
MPMLDGDDWQQLSRMLDQRLERIKNERREKGLTLDEIPMATHDEALLDAHFKLTGARLKSVGAIYHHRVDRYGPPCKHCGKPLRTSRARFCAECGQPRVGQSASW